MNYIMIVEDDHELRNLLIKLLHLQYPGVRVESANRITQAYNTLIHREPFDLVIVDGHLPDGDGAQLVECIVKAYGGPPFLGISGDPSALEELGMAGCRAVLGKPFTAEALFEAIESLGVIQEMEEEIDAGT